MRYGGDHRRCTKHNYLVRRVEDLPRILHEAFYIASHGRPGPVVVDIPKDVQFATGAYTFQKNVRRKTYQPQPSRATWSVFGMRSR